MRQPFLLVKKDVRGKKLYYAKIWNEDSHKYLWKSVGAMKEELNGPAGEIPHTSKAGASRICQLWIANNSENKKSTENFKDYLLSFWEEDSMFLKSKKLRGKTYSSLYIRNNYSGIENYFIPFLEATKKEKIQLYQVNADLLESFINYMTDKNEVGNKRINDILQAVKVALSEAYRLGKIQENVGIKVSKLQTIKPEREIFSAEEVKAFFKQPQEDFRFYVINLLAATTGMRMGECRGLLIDDIKDGYIEVRHNWQDGEGLKAPKWGSARIVPVPSRTQDALKKLISITPFNSPFVFYGTDETKPLRKEEIYDRYKETLGNIGIEEKARTDRGLKFHAWRHCYNTILRGNIPYHALRK